MSKNASGLTPEESRALKQRQPNDSENAILSKSNELYGCKPTEASYSFYAKDAVFHDPIGYAEGLTKIKEQFNGLAKLFETATVDRQVVLENPASLKNHLLVDQDVTYCRNADKPTKKVNSLLTFEFDGSGKVIRHTEEWDHKKESSSDDGFFGMLSEGRKRLTANLTGAFVPSDASKV